MLSLINTHKSACGPDRPCAGRFAPADCSNQGVYGPAAPLWEIPETDLCGAMPGRALSVPQRHAPLLEALTSIPVLEPGDAVFWLSDVVHAVEDQHRGHGYSNVMYMGATVGCAKNTAYLARQAPSYPAGLRPISIPTTSKSIFGDAVRRTILPRSEGANLGCRPSSGKRSAQNATHHLIS